MFYLVHQTYSFEKVWTIDNAFRHKIALMLQHGLEMGSQTVVCNKCFEALATGYKS